MEMTSSPAARRAAITPPPNADHGRYAVSDWMLYLLLAGAVMTLPLSIQTSGWAPYPGRIVWAAVWGALAGVFMARSSRRPAGAWLIGALLGIIYAAQAATRILPGASVILRDFWQAMVGIWGTVSGEIATAPPLFSRSIAHVATQYGLVEQGFGHWLTAVSLGSSSRDTTLLLFAVALLVWLLSWNAAFQLLRHGRGMAALLPLCVALLANVSYTDLGMGYVRFFVGVFLLTLVRTHVMRLIGQWGRSNVDFSPDLTQNVTSAGASLAALVLVVALSIPYMTYNPALEFFWGHMGPYFEEFYGKLDRAFAGRNPVPEPPPEATDEGHELSRAAPLGTGAVMTVRTSDPPPPSIEQVQALGRSDPRDFVVPRYWRQRTYDVYTGRGWENSETAVVELAADEPWDAPDYPGAVLTQTFSVNTRYSRPSAAAGEALSVDRPYAVTLRAADDLTSFQAEVPTYTVVSRIAEPTAAQLMAAEGDYPEWVSDRYLALPEIPERVRDLSRQIITEAGARTRYEKARAIEAYIRAYTYDLRLPPPPRGEDVVDYFLFSAQRGYCDYSGTAMAVMLRSVGVAARYASGYRMGSYDYASASWIVHENNSHAWTEVYFPEYGWIVFEPTPIERIFDYEDTEVVAALPPPKLVPAAPSPPRAGAHLALWIAGMLGLIGFVVVWPPRYLRTPALAPRDAIRAAYRRLVRRARWAGYAPTDGQTPAEYLRVLDTHLAARARDAAGAVHAAVAGLDSAYQRARYSQEAISAAEAAHVQEGVRHLTRSLWPLVFTRPVRARRR